MGHAIQERYYSGQGVVLLGRRGTDGKPLGLRPIGNVSDLKTTIATSVLEHKESTTGARGTDLRLTTEVKSGLSMTMENFNKDNLAQVMRGTATTIPAGSETVQPTKGYTGMVTALGKIKIASLVLTMVATPLVAYVNDTTAWDYKPNLEAGSYQLNDPVASGGVGFSALGTTATAIAVGATTRLTFANTALVGGKAFVYGVTGAVAAGINGKSYNIVAATSTYIDIDYDSTGDTLTATGSRVVWDGIAILAAYTYPVQYVVDALTEGATEYFMRFEGLNTAEDNAPVIVEAFRFLADPLKELALISDTVQQFVLEGSVLADNLQPTGSKYIKAQKLN